MWKGRDERRNVGIQMEKEECRNSGMKEGMWKEKKECRKKGNEENEGM